MLPGVQFNTLKYIFSTKPRQELGTPFELVEARFYDIHRRPNLRQEILEDRRLFWSNNHGPVAPVDYVIRLSLGRRLVHLLPVAQRTNAFTDGVVDRPWVVGREFGSHVHENAF